MSSKYKKYKLGEKYIVIDKGFTLSVYDHNDEVHLFPQSKKILRLLMEAKLQDRDVSKEEIYDCLWDSAGALQKSSDETIRGCIKKLRDELGRDIIRTIYGAGYSLNESIVELRNDDIVENQMQGQVLSVKEPPTQMNQEYSCSGELDSAFIQLDILYSQMTGLAVAIEKLGFEIFETIQTLPEEFKKSGNRLLNDFTCFDSSFDSEARDCNERIQRAYEQKKMITVYKCDSEDFLALVFEETAAVYDNVFKWVCKKESQRQEFEIRLKQLKDEVKLGDDDFWDDFFNV